MEHEAAATAANGSGDGAAPASPAALSTQRQGIEDSTPSGQGSVASTDAEESLQAENHPEPSQPSTGGDVEPDDAVALAPTSDDADASDVSLAQKTVSVDVSTAAQDETVELQQQQEAGHEPEQDGAAAVPVAEITEAAGNTEPLEELEQLEATADVAEQTMDRENPTDAADPVAVVAVASATEAEAGNEEQQNETQQEVPPTVQNDSKDSSVVIQSDEAATPVAPVESPSAVEVVANTEASSLKQQSEQSQDTSAAVESKVTDTATPEASATVSAGSATTEEQGAKTAVLVDEQTAPVPDKNECAISVPAATTASEPHGDDEYDPANPSPAGTPAASTTASAYGSCRPTIEQEEYDPDFPSMTSSPAGETPTAMEVDSSTPTANGTSSQSTSTPAKRKVEEMTTGSHPSTSGARADSGKEKELKRLRHGEKKSPRDEGRRPRRGSGDTTSSPSNSKAKPQEVDHKGLSAAAWDRLMDFQTGGEFRLTQVSRAAFASVGAMPEFAQIAIVARFARTPLKGVRDKNGQLMRIYREYQKENPQIAALQSVDAFIADYKSDPGLFRFGYAPPQPITGVSSMAVPYQRDQPVEEEVAAKNSPQAKRTTPRSEQQQQQQGVDEFGRVVHRIRATASESTGSPRTSTPKPVATDPRRNARSRQDPPAAAVASQSAAQAAPQSSMEASSNGLLPVTAGRPLDPRRRDQPSPSRGSSSSAAGRDPRRRGSQPGQPPSRGASTSGSRGGASGNEMYERLPGRVKAVIDSMRGEGRLQEPLNDNVVSRLLHLPEHVALQAVENFSNVDLALVENLQGFLVGIINRVNEKAIAAEKQQQRQQGPSPRAQPAPTPSRGGYSTPSSSGSVLGGPPPDGRLGGNGSGFRGQGGPGAPSGRGDAGVGPSPALYERPYESSRDPRRQQQALQRGPPPSVGPGPGGRPGSAPNSFTALPMSVQNHILSLVNNGTLSSLEELGGNCYELIGQLSEPLANQVLTRFASANLATVRNRSGFLIGVVKRCRQEYGFN